jgi:riboflavin biosynthesis pyrimidine reductase
VKPLEALFEADVPAGLGLPPELRGLYGGDLGLDESLVYTNFVCTLDGIVAIPSEPRSNRLISADSEADRFVMGLLRASADAVLIGAGTLGGSPKSVWTADRAYPDGAKAFAELRELLRLAPTPELAVVSASGSIDPGHPALEQGAIVVTNELGAARLDGRMPAASELVVLGDDPTIEPRAVIDLLRSRGHRRILSEAGPHLFGSLLEADVVDELFLTVSPLLAGRAEEDGRLALVEGAELLPEHSGGWRLLSLRRHDDHLFLRFRR